MKRDARWESLILWLLLAFLQASPLLAAGRWGPDTAQAWFHKRGWLVGCNYIPSSAINPIEMWQRDTFDLPAVRRELAYAESLGFNSIRVFLHHLPYFENRQGFLKRMDQFLSVAHHHHIGVMFVLLDGCWDPYPQPGVQRAPRPYVHNSGWVQCPGVNILSNVRMHDDLQAYVAGIIRHFRDDPRIDAWDLFNEPDNMNRPAYERYEPEDKPDLAARLLSKAYAWARDVHPSQPLTAGVWVGTWNDPDRLSPIEQLMLQESDVISFHNYGKLEELTRCVDNLRRYNRPLLCTEYMARPNGSTFDPHLGYLKKQGVGAYNWGFVSGKTQTIYPWDSYTRRYTGEPPVWFHDILRTDGTPFNQKEVDYIRIITGKVDNR